MATSFTMSEQPRPSPLPTARSNEEISSQSSWIRPLKQFGFFALGAGLMAASVAVSRRAVVRRRLDSFPKFYYSNRTKLKFDSSERSVMAAEALGLATLNVMNFGVMLVGGVFWAFDISSVEELQARSDARRQRSGIASPEDDEQMEQMMSDLLARLGMDKPKEPEAPNEAEGPKQE